MHGAYCTDIRHRGGMLNKTPPPTELQIPATVTTLITVALCNWADHYIFALWFLSSSSSFFLSFFSSPNLSGRRLDVYHTSTHGVALLRI